MFFLDISCKKTNNTYFFLGGKGRNFGGGGRQIVTDPEELKIPLQYGWRRETTIRYRMKFEMVCFCP